MGFVVAAVIASAVSLCAAEVLAWFPWLAERLIRRVTRLLPPDERERWRAEWLAELDAIPGFGISRLLWAISVAAGVPAMRRSYRPRPSPAPAQLDTLLLGFLLLVLLLAWQSAQREGARRAAGEKGGLAGQGFLSGQRPVPSRSQIHVARDGAQPDVVVVSNRGSTTLYEIKVVPKKH